MFLVFSYSLTYFCLLYYDTFLFFPVSYFSLFTLYSFSLLLLFLLSTYSTSFYYFFPFLAPFFFFRGLTDLGFSFTAKYFFPIFPYSTNLSLIFLVLLFSSNSSIVIIVTSVVFSPLFVLPNGFTDHSYILLNPSSPHIPSNLLT